MPYKDIWKKLVKEENNNLTRQNVNASEPQNNFQRKIDPSLDDLYNFEPVNNKFKTVNPLKVLVVSAEQVALCGHMARVGEILGIAELCLPSTKIVEMEEFSNVSVTAEKWLNITEHGFQGVKSSKQPNK
jgi:hypothetical protein